MRLSRMRLSGFKSFVDPTDVTFPSALVGIVGPNGCGKSNLIDAVRWVMGESSARHLRGQAMDDVIFSGSTTRKPVGLASVELLFDNSAGRLQGEFARQAEISVRRVMTRDGESKYFLNGSRCRRRDILDVFLGTGLGPRAYAIIEQGMISRIVEARPEELRGFIEEAAGISRYRERRRETAQRIQHTRENLQRLNDVREEIGRQLERLERQSRTAARYRELTAEIERLAAERQALRWREASALLDAREREVAERLARGAEAQAVRLQAEAAQQDSEAQQRRVQAQVDALQTGFFEAGAQEGEAALALKQAEQQLEARQDALNQVERDRGEREARLLRDRERLVQLNLQQEAARETLAEAEGREQEAQAALVEAETQAETAQRAWEGVSLAIAAPQQALALARAQAQSLEGRRRQQAERLGRLPLAEAERELSVWETRHAEAESRLRRLSVEVEMLEAAQSADEARHGAREALREQESALAALRQAEQTARGRLTALETLQQDALHGQTRDARASAALRALGLEECPRLGEQLRVRPGWEGVVEQALGEHLRALCVADLDVVLDSLSATASTGKPALSGEFIECEAPQAPHPWLESAASSGDWLAGVLPAQDLQEARERRGTLAPGQRFILSDGTQLGRHWLRLPGERRTGPGVLERQAELDALRQQLQQTQVQRQALEGRVSEETRALREAEQRQAEQQRRLREVLKTQGEARAALEQASHRRQQAATRLESLRQERLGLLERQERDDAALEQQRADIAALEETLAGHEQARSQAETARRAATGQVARVREQARQARENVHRTALALESLRSEQSALSAEQMRLEQECQALMVRQAEAEAASQAAGAPLPALRAALEAAAAKRTMQAGELAQARVALAEAEARLAETARRRQAAQEMADTTRAAEEAARLSVQEARVALEFLLDEAGLSAAVLAERAAALPESASVAAWREAQADAEARRSRLGAVNLAAIEEFEEARQRKEMLDAQDADLNEALRTLETAMARMDRETRGRFRETFDTVNQRFAERFTRLFGGGEAYLRLCGDDLLEAGVELMSRPPGKRISTLSLLSGGEKALTAVALVFALFSLNPAPFCMLDEVDAPLDEANVGRFCAMVADMAQQVQFIFITHNKATMELASQLTGVTMREPGVSRIVAVDLDEAVRLAGA